MRNKTSLRGIQIDASLDDNVLMEARNLRNMTMAQTPLLGDENTPLHIDPTGGSGFDGATPRHQVAFTPNPLATPRDVQVGPSATPRTIAGTPLRTPLRDNLSINPGDSVSGVPAKHALRAGFKSLPKPENNFELLLPEEEEQEASESTETLEDAEERDARERRRRREEEEKALRRRSAVVRQSLPRPPNVELPGLMERLDINTSRTVYDAEFKEARRLVDQELAELVQHDSLQYPLPGTARSGISTSTYQIPDDSLLDAAREAVQSELAGLAGFPGANPQQLQDGLKALAKSEYQDNLPSWFDIRKTLAYDASSKSWLAASTLSQEQRIAGYSALLEESRESMTKDANKAAKLEKKLGITLGGYQQRAKAVASRITSAFEELQRQQIDYESFLLLQSHEAVAGPRRLASLKEEVDKLETREAALQRRYAELASEKREAEAKISALEDQLMAEAEAINEAQLAAMEA